MRNLMVRVAVFGMGCALCFGTVACGAEELIPPMPEQAMQKQMTTETTTEAQPIEELMQDWKLVQYTVKGETTKASELTKNELETMAPRFSCSDGVHVLFQNSRQNHNGTVREENGKYVISYNDNFQGKIATVSGDKLTIVNEKGTLELIFEVRGDEPEEVEVEAVPMIEQWDDSVVERYVASNVVTKEEVVALLESQGQGVSDYFADGDYSFDVLMDLKDDGSAIIYYDFEIYIRALKEGMSNNFNDVMLAKYEEQDGMSREEVEQQMLDMGFKSLEEGLDNLRVSAMERVDPMLRNLMSNIKDMRIRMNWKKDGDTQYLVGHKDIEFNEDGSLDYTLPAAKSLTGKECDLHFVPVAR